MADLTAFATLRASLALVLIALRLLLLYLEAKLLRISG